MDLQWSRRGLGPAPGDQRGAETLPGPRALTVLISSLVSDKPHIAFPGPSPPPASLPLVSGFRPFLELPGVFMCLWSHVSA